MDQVIKEYLAKNGRKGGKSKSEAKVLAVKSNLEKANKALQEYWKNKRKK